MSDDAKAKARQAPATAIGANGIFDAREAEFIRIIAEGGTVQNAADKIGVNKSTIFRWLDREDAVELRNQYTRARETQADIFADEIIDVARASKPETATSDRVLIDTLKWAAGKRKPKVYGDKLELSGDEKSPLTVNVLTHFKVGEP